MSDPNQFYPWTMDWPAVLALVGVAVGLLVMVYLSMRQGRLEKSNKPTSGKEPLHVYPDGIQTDANKPSLFLIVLMVGIVIWSVGYVIYHAVTGILLY